jgi:hypothetical protein
MMKFVLLFSLFVVTLAEQTPKSLKLRYLDMHNVKLWENTLVEEMDGTIYDKTVADPWFGAHPFLTNHDQPLVLTFMRRPQPGFPDVVTAKDSFALKTLYLLA